MQIIRNKKYTPRNHFVYENNYFRFIPFLKLKKLLNRNNIDLDNKTLLIASCGSGIDAYYLKKTYKPKKIYFADITINAIEKAQSNFSDQSFILSDNHNLAFKENSFDYVFIGDSIHHLKEPIRGVYELLRVARYGLMVIEPNDSWFMRLFEKLGLAHEYEPTQGNYVYRFNKRDVHKITKAMFLKYNVIRCFAIHKVAKNNIELQFFKVLNWVANIICHSLGNYIIFLIKKEIDLPKCMQKRF